MYRSNLNSRDKGGAVAAVIAIHAALLFALLHISGKINFASSQSVMRVFDECMALAAFSGTQPSAYPESA